MKRGRIDDFWKLSARSGLLPRETREYVPMILAAIVIARNPVHYGFEFEPSTPASHDVVTLPGPVDLRRVAEWTDSTIDTIQSLNPELRRWTTPVKDSAYEMRVPAGTADIVKARLEEAAESELASLRWYTVRKGESLATIARKLKVSRTDLAEANYLRTSSRVAAGQKLIVPHEATVLMAARTDRPAPATEAHALAASAVVPAVATTAATSSDMVKTYYRVKKGDTLASIARAFKTTVRALQTWNSLPGSQIMAGSRLTIYTARGN
jgi:membrane-bound lytic murein transglycosylase D